MFRTVISAVASIVILVSALVSAQMVYDDFHPKWTIIKNGTGPSINSVKQRLEITIPANTTGNAKGNFAIGYQSTCMLHNDFDIEVRYALLTYPDANGVQISLAVGNGKAIIARNNDAQIGSVYLANFSGSITSLPTNDTKGKLRLVRIGDTVNGYYYTAPKWVSVGSGKVDSADTGFSIQASGQNSSFSKAKVVVAFDDFVINKGNIVGDNCPFASLTNDLDPLPLDYPDYTSSDDVLKSQVMEGLFMLPEIKKAINDFWIDHGYLPASNASAGLASPTSYVGNYVDSIDVGTVSPGLITITYGNKINSKAWGSTLGIGPVANGAGNLVWVCGGNPDPTGTSVIINGSGGPDQTTRFTATTLDQRYLPSYCRF